MKLLLSLIESQATGLTLTNQLLYAAALIAPFCGVVLGLTFMFNMKGIFRWIITWSTPAIWLCSIIALVSQLPAKQHLLLIAAILVAIPITGIFYLILTIISLGNIKDSFTNKRKNFEIATEAEPSVEISEEAQPLPKKLGELLIF